MFKSIFKNKPIIGVIHLDPLPLQEGYKGIDSLMSMMLENLTSSINGGVDAVIIENEHDHPHTLKISKAQVAALTVLVKKAVEVSKVPIGVSALLLDWEAAFAVANAAGAKFVRLNVFVDKVMRELSTWATVDISARGFVEVNPYEVIAYRKALGCEDILLLTDIHVKYMQLLEINKTVAESVKLAHKFGADAVIVSGKRTGIPTDKADIKAAKVIKDFPIIIGSGLNQENVAELLPYADGAIVGTAFEENGKVDVKLVKSFMDKVNNLKNIN